MKRICCGIGIVVHLCFMMLSSHLFGQEANAKKTGEDGGVIYIEAAALFKCRVVLPDYYNKGDKYPLVVGLHGRYGNAEYAESIWKMFGLKGYIFVAPQGPYPEGKPGSYSWCESDDEVKGLWDKSKKVSEDYIVGVTRYIINEYSVDTSQVYLLGHSQGAAMAFNTGIRNQELYTGLICFNGWLNKYWIGEESLKKAGELKVFIAHGKNDNTVKYERGVEALEILKEYGCEVTLFGFDGGHGMSDKAVKAAVKWLKRQTASGEETD